MVFVTKKKTEKKTGVAEAFCCCALFSVMKAGVCERKLMILTEILLTYFSRGHAPHTVIMHF